MYIAPVVKNNTEYRDELRKTKQIGFVFGMLSVLTFGIIPSYFKILKGGTSKGFVARNYAQVGRSGMLSDFGRVANDIVSAFAAVNKKS